MPDLHLTTSDSQMDQFASLLTCSEITRTEMNLTRPQVELVVFNAIESVNQQLDAAQALRATESQQLLGSETSMSSLTLVTLVVRIEQILAEVYGMQVALADEKALSRSQSPFRTVGGLIEYISELSDG